MHDANLASRWNGKPMPPAWRPALELVGAGLVAALIFWAAVSWLSSVILAMALTAVWLAAAVIVLRGRIHQNVALAALSVVVTVACLELALRGGLVPGSSAFLHGPSEWDRGRTELNTPPFVEPEPRLGFHMVGPRRSRSIVTRDGVPVFDVFYTIDRGGFRATPGAAAGRPVLVMGDSFHFGFGLEDDQTLAFHLGDQSGGAFRAINFATPGYGPHQVLRQLQLGIPLASGVRKFDHLLLSVLDEHVWRASGELTWQWNSPRYELLDGRLVLAGALGPSSRFMATLMRDSKEAILLTEVLKDRANDRRRFAAILKEIRTEARERYGAEVLALYHVGVNFAGEPIGDRSLMHALICAAGVPYVDVVRRLSITRESVHRDYIPADHHPTPALNARIARLVRDYADGKEQPDRCGA
jgi:hypothetical protein